MSKGGYRGGGRPRIHLDDAGEDHSIPAQFLLTPETDRLLERLCEWNGIISRSEMIRRLIVEAAQAKGIKP